MRQLPLRSYRLQKHLPGFVICGVHAARDPVEHCTAHKRRRRRRTRQGLRGTRKGLAAGSGGVDLGGTVRGRTGTLWRRGMGHLIMHGISPLRQIAETRAEDHHRQPEGSQEQRQGLQKREPGARHELHEQQLSDKLRDVLAQPIGQQQQLKVPKRWPAREQDPQGSVPQRQQHVEGAACAEEVEGGGRHTAAADVGQEHSDFDEFLHRNQHRVYEEQTAEPGVRVRVHNAAQPLVILAIGFSFAHALEMCKVLRITANHRHCLCQSSLGVPPVYFSVATGGLTSNVLEHDGVASKIGD
mmetsp:Transcript_64672/g.107171  ORF Transcript_64672/g.107171 Transcript_64672/m.107171 type:complete len:299 (+) Transcript_64672:463-1359(+)